MMQFDKIAPLLSPAPPPIPVEGRDETLDLGAIARVVRRRIGLILIVGATVLLALVPLILTIQRTYTATARVLIHEPLPPALLKSGLVPESELNLTTEGERLVSRKLAERVIAELDLARRAEFDPGLGDQSLLSRARAHLKTLVSGEMAGANPDTDGMDAVVRSYLERLGVAQAAGSGVVSISFRSQDPELAAMVPNTVMRAYLEDSQRRAADRTAKATAWVEGRVSDQEARLARTTAAANAARKDVETASAAASGAAQALADLSERRSEIVRRRAELDTRVSAFDGATDLQGKVDAVNTESLFMLGRQLDLERAELDRMLRRYGSAQTGMVAAEARVAAESRIASLERSMEAEVMRERRNMTTELAALDREQQAITAELSDAEQAVAEVNGAQARLDRLQRAADVEQAAVNALQDQLRGLRAEASLPAAEIEVLSPATFPLVADGRSRTWYLAAALFAAALVALTSAFAVEMTDRTVRSFEQLRHIAGVTSAGFLPAVPRRALRDPRSRRMRRRNRLYRDSVEAVALGFEDYGSGLLPPSILVTAALPHDGASTTAFALACHMAASGRRVVLVDADLRNGMLHERFRQPPGLGLSDYLSGAATLEQVVRHDPGTGMSFVTRGTGDTGRHIDWQLARRLVADSADHNRTVIFDAAPALVTNEALALAGISHRIVLVVQWARTSRSAVEAAVDRLAPRAGRVIDLVVNRVNLRRQALYGYRDAGDLARSLRRFHDRAA